MLRLAHIFVLLLGKKSHSMMSKSGLLHPGSKQVKWSKISLGKKSVGNPYGIDQHKNSFSEQVTFTNH